MHCRVVLSTYISLTGCSDAAPIPRAPAPSAELSTSSSVPGPTEHEPAYWENEIAWARSRFPELRSFTAEADLEPLLAWVPEGREVTLFINVEDDKYPYHCAAATAVRTEPGYIRMVVPDAERTEKGQTVRDFVFAGASREGVDVFYGGGKQRRNPDGTWEEIDLYATTGRDLGGGVGPVEGDTAHFRYLSVRIEASCGPKVPVPCHGRKRLCNRCEDITIELRSPKTHPSVPMPEMTCKEPCPKVVNPDLERIKQIAENFPIGKVLDPEPFGAALYRTLEACRTDPLWKTTPKPSAAP